MHLFDRYYNAAQRLCKGSARTLAVIVFGLALPQEGQAQTGNSESSQGNPKNEREAFPSKGPTAIRKESVQERDSRMRVLGAEMRAAKTPSERQAVMERWRVQQPMLAAPVDGKAMPQRIEEMKIKASGNPEALQRLAVLEERLVSEEKMKAALAAMEKAEGAEKEALKAEIQKERRMMVESHLASLKTKTAELPTPSPAMEARREEVENFRKALQESGPQERAALMKNFREKQQQAMKQKSSASNPEPSL